MHLLIDNLPLELTSKITQFKKKIQATFMAQFLWSRTKRANNFYEYLINIYAHYACSIAEAGSSYTITIKH